MVTERKVEEEEPEVTVKIVTYQELWDELAERLERKHMTVEEFRVEGYADRLTDGYLRDLWLMYRPLLFDNDPAQIK
ncbi:MAG: hypothetical protein F4Y75_02945 [Acidimicrobiia bacterium]|nr:hypothetical protein [Acidimicrobiia bacterium]